MDTEILKDEDGAAPSTAPVHYILDEANVPMMSNLLNLFAFIEDFRTFLEVPEVPFTLLKGDVEDGNLQKGDDVTKVFCRIMRGFYAKDRSVPETQIHTSMKNTIKRLSNDRDVIQIALRAEFPQLSMEHRICELALQQEAVRDWINTGAMANAKEGIMRKAPVLFETGPEQFGSLWHFGRDDPALQFFAMEHVTMHPESEYIVLQEPLTKGENEPKAEPMPDQQQVPPIAPNQTYLDGYKTTSWSIMRLDQDNDLKRLKADDLANKKVLPVDRPVRALTKMTNKRKKRVIIDDDMAVPITSSCFDEDYVGPDGARFYLDAPKQIRERRNEALAKAKAKTEQEQELAKQTQEKAQDEIAVKSEAEKPETSQQKPLDDDEEDDEESEQQQENEDEEDEDEEEQDDDESESHESEAKKSKPVDEHDDDNDQNDDDDEDVFEGESRRKLRSRQSTKLPKSSSSRMNISKSTPTKKKENDVGVVKQLTFRELLEEYIQPIESKRFEVVYGKMKAAAAKKQGIPRELIHLAENIDYGAEHGLRRRASEGNRERQAHLKARQLIGEIAHDQPIITQGMPDGPHVLSASECRRLIEQGLTRTTRNTAKVLENADINMINKLLGIRRRPGRPRKNPMPEDMTNPLAGLDIQEKIRLLQEQVAIRQRCDQEESYDDSSDSDDEQLYEYEAEEQVHDPPVMVTMTMPPNNTVNPFRMRDLSLPRCQCEQCRKPLEQQLAMHGGTGVDVDVLALMCVVPAIVPEICKFPGSFIDKEKTILDDESHRLMVRLPTKSTKPVEPEPEPEYESESEHNDDREPKYFYEQPMNVELGSRAAARKCREAVKHAIDDDNDFEQMARSASKSKKRSLPLVTHRPTTSSPPKSRPQMNAMTSDFSAQHHSAGISQMPLTLPVMPVQTSNNNMQQQQQYTSSMQMPMTMPFNMPMMMPMQMNQYDVNQMMMYNNGQMMMQQPGHAQQQQQMYFNMQPQPGGYQQYHQHQ